MQRLSWLIAVMVAFLVLSGIYCQALAQGVSPIDTLKVEHAYGLPGDSVTIRIYLANDSIEVGGINFLLGMDTTYVHPALVFADSAYVYYQMVNRGVGVFAWVRNVSSPATLGAYGRTVSGVFIGDSPSDKIPRGSGSFVQFWVHIKDNAPLGDSVRLRLYNETIPGGRMNMLSDPDGLYTVDPTLVSGWVHFGEPVNQPNSPPYFTTPASGQQFNVEQGQEVQFGVTAADMDVGQAITLSMISGPAGSVFQTVAGTGSVSSTFTWSTNFSHSGSYNATFQVIDDSSAIATRTVTISVGTGPPPEEDFLYTTSKTPGGFVEGGMPGAVDVSVPISLSDMNTLYGIEFNINYNYVVMRLDSVVQTNRLLGFEVYSQGIGAGKMKVVAFGLSNETIQPPDPNSNIFNCWFSIYATAQPGWYTFSLRDGRASLQPGQPSASVLVDTLGNVAVDRLGDVNLDTLVDVGDLVTVVGYIIGDYDLEVRQFRAGNTNGDSEVNVVDLVGIVNIIFTGSPPSPAPKFAYSGRAAELAVSLPNESMPGSGRIALEADLPTQVAGLQFDLVYDANYIELGQPELTELSDQLILRYRDSGQGRMRVVIYSQSAGSDHVIEPGIGRIVTIPVHTNGGSAVEDSPVTLENTVLADPSGREIPVARKHGLLPATFSLEQNFPNPFNPETSIGFSIHGSEMQSVQLTIYNILGQSVVTLLDEDLAPGTYEAVWDGTDSSGRKQASGVYFYSLIVGDSRDTKKMVLTK